MDNSVMDNSSDMSQTHAEAPIQATEKMLSQSQVNEIVGNAKREAAAKAVDAFKSQQTQPYAQSPNAQQQFNEPNSYREDDIKRLAGDEIKRHFTKLEQDAQERANVDAANRVVGMFKEKITAGRDKFEDFENVTSNVAMQYYPNVVQLLAEHVDNTAEVLYHLAQNRDKLYRLEALSSHNPSDGIYEVKRLAESIRANEQAVGQRDAKAPLSQQRPSNTGTESGGALSMADLKRKYRG